MIESIFQSNRKTIRELCKKYEVEKLYFFGSSVNGKFVEGKSDLDIYIEIPIEKIKNLVRLKNEFRKIFKCPIDMFHESWIRHTELQKYIAEQKVLIYEKPNTRE